MKRIAIDNRDGKWFDADKAKKYEEGTRWDGSNRISLATGSQWEHEALYVTRSGNWVLNHWSDREGSRESHDIISAPNAADWLIRNDREVPPELAEAAAAQEV